MVARITGSDRREHGAGERCVHTVSCTTHKARPWYDVTGVRQHCMHRSCIVYIALVLVLSFSVVEVAVVLVVDVPNLIVGNAFYDKFI